MIYTTKQTKSDFFKKIIKAIGVAVFWIIIWETASRIVSIKNELLLNIFPTPFMVLKKWFELILTASFLKTVTYTFLRIFFGFIIGVAVGFILGIITHISNIFYELLAPIIKIIRAIPVIAIIILLYLFLQSNTLPIWIVVLMVTPLVWQTIHDGLNNTDKALLEMATVFRLSKTKKLFSVKIPQIMPSFITVCVNALGLAWKSGIAAEVLCLPDISIGTMMWQSKGYVNYDEVYALTLTVILLSAFTEFLLKFLCKKYLYNNGGIAND